MTTRGFTAVELLVATVMTLLVIGGGVVMAASARWSLAVEPAAIDTTRRAREGVFALTEAVGSAGGGVAAGDGVLTLAASVPVVRPLTSLDESPGDRFTALWLLRAVPGAVGRLAQPQEGPAGSLTLDATGPCPQSTGVCGFRLDDVAVVFDDRGHFDVFDVAAVSDALIRIVPRVPLSRAYGTGDWVLSARVDRFGLVRQPDGSGTLTRVSWAGAVEPLVDGVVDLDIVPWGRPEAPSLRDADEGPGLSSYGLTPPPPDEIDDDGIFADGEHCMARRVGGAPRSPVATRPVDVDGLSQLAPADFDDGPWCPSSAAPSGFDADLLRVQRLDIRMRVEALAAEFRGSAGALFTRGGTATRDGRRWIADRTLQVSVAVNGR